MSFRARLTGGLVEHLPMVNLENLENSLTEIRQAAREYYARKNGSWKPKRDLDAEHLEDMARYGREMGMYAGSWIIPRDVMIMRKIIDHRPDPEVSVRFRELSEKMKRVKDAFSGIDFSSVEDKVRKMIFIDESHVYEPKTLYHTIRYEDRVTLGAGKNPFAEHTIRGVKKSHRKSRFSKKSRRGIMLQG